MGKKLTKKDLLGQLIRQASQHLEATETNLPALEEDPAWLLLGEPEHWGIHDTSTTVDNYLYRNRGA
jgi:hypothetical protein